MTRTVVILDDDDKRWLDERAARESVPRTELIRRAVRRLKRELEREQSAFEDVLGRTAGILTLDDALRYVRETRGDW